MFAQLNIASKEFELCMKDPQILEMVKKSAEAGNKAGIQGTPSFFINGKQIQHSSKLLILQKVYDHLKNEK